MLDREWVPVGNPVNVPGWRTRWMENVVDERYEGVYWVMARKPGWFHHTHISKELVEGLDDAGSLVAQLLDKGVPD